MKKFLIFFLFILFLSCSGGKKNISFIIKGDKYFLESIEPMLPQFLQRHSHLKLILEPVEDARAIASYLDGTSDIAISSRLFNAEEMNHAAGLNKQVQPYPIASSAVSVILSEENKLQNINMELLKKILTLQVVDWSEVIKERINELFRLNQRERAERLLKISDIIFNQKIEVCVLNSLFSLHSIILEKANIRYFSSKIRLFSTEKSLIRYVAAHRNAIGFVSSVIKTPRCRKIPVNFVEPTHQSIFSNEYPMIVKHYIFIPKNYKGIEIIDLVLFLRSPAVQAKLRERGFSKP